MSFYDEPDPYGIIQQIDIKAFNLSRKQNEIIKTIKETFERFKWKSDIEENIPMQQWFVFRNEDFPVYSKNGILLFIDWINCDFSIYAEIDGNLDIDEYKHLDEEDVVFDRKSGISEVWVPKDMKCQSMKIKIAWSEEFANYKMIFRKDMY